MLDPELGREIDEEVAAHRDWLQSLRRDLHRHPELRFEEFRTSGRIREEMEALGLELRTGLGGTGLTATLEGASPATPGLGTVALRADLDALPMQEETGLAFASENDGVMHACGHDAHSATVATMARIVARSERLREALPGRLVFLFQPAEEGGMGAQEMILAGALEDPAIEAMLGFHVHPVLPTGEISVYRSYSHASADCFVLRFRGKGGHAGYPHLSRDPLTPAAEMLLGLRTLVAREVDPLIPSVISVGMVRAGHANNVTPETVTLEGTLRCFDEEVRAYLKERMAAMAAGFAEAHRCEARIEWDQGCPATRNDPRIAEVFHQSAGQILEAGKVHEHPPGMGAEDFGVFSQSVPGALFRLGCTPPDAEQWWPLHNPRFHLDEDSLEIAARILLRTAFQLSIEGFPPGVRGSSVLEPPADPASPETGAGS